VCQRGVRRDLASQHHRDGHAAGREGPGETLGAQPTDDVRAPPGAPRPTSVREPGSGPSAPRSSAPLEFRGEAPPGVRNLASPDPGLGPPGSGYSPPAWTTD